jgi:hypothetical protein
MRRAVDFCLGTFIDAVLCSVLYSEQSASPVRGRLPMCGRSIVAGGLRLLTFIYVSTN